MCFSPQWRAIFRHLNVQKWSKHAVFCTFWLSNVHFATAACNFSTSEQTKVVPDRQFFSIFTSECAFRHSGVQFFDIWTSKSGPNMRCFVRFDFQMCISPQRRAIFRHLNRQKWSRIVSFLAFSLPNVLFATVACNFRHLNVQKWSKHAVFCTFWLANVLFATAACNFSTSEQTKVVPDRQFFSIFTSECAFRHSGVQFFDIWTSKSGPNMRCFVHFDLQMCFSPQRRAIFDFSSEHRPPHPPL